MVVRMTTTTPDTITLADGRTVDVARVDWIGARRAVVHYVTPAGYRDTVTATPREVITRRIDAPAGITVAPGHVITERRTDDGRFTPGRFTVTCSCGGATFTGCRGPGHAASVAITHDRDIRHAAGDHTACLANVCAVVYRADAAASAARFGHPVTADGSPVATDRDPAEPCEAGTVGCCVRHNDRADRGCDTW